DSHSIFILEIGNVIIEKSINKEKTLFKELAYISAPSFVGEIALFEEIPRTARVRATTTCEIIEISKESFKKILEHRPDLANEMLLFMSKTLSLRLAHTSKELTLLYDISKHLTETHTDEKELLTKITEAI
ncbi:MAG: cyclic nucleotide-binding domain-containing protein, partial [Elusimicrobiales bacterium]|nr:cyclic nucleotide-binding domain-containing protein [Elusimicrobiales bacterium]